MSSPQTLARLRGGRPPSGENKVLRCQRRVAWSRDGSKLRRRARSVYERLPLLVVWENGGRGVRTGDCPEHGFRPAAWGTGVAFGGAGFFGLVDGDGSTSCCVARSRRTCAARLARLSFPVMPAASTSALNTAAASRGFRCQPARSASCSGATVGQYDITGLPVEGWQDSLSPPKLASRRSNCPRVRHAQPRHCATSRASRWARMDTAPLQCVRPTTMARSVAGMWGRQSVGGRP
jgi:hypothetical protein